LSSISLFSIAALSRLLVLSLTEIGANYDGQGILEASGSNINRSIFSSMNYHERTFILIWSQAACQLASTTATGRVLPNPSRP
jgi:hypothetical protein